jgi:hypothetical protein
MFPFDFRIYLPYQNKLFFLTLFISRETVSFYVHTRVAKIHSLVRACFDAFSAPSLVSLVVNHRRVTWSRPTEGMVCLNVDESLLGSINTTWYGARHKWWLYTWSLWSCSDTHFVCWRHGSAARLAAVLGFPCNIENIELRIWTHYNTSNFYATTN